ncbi:hypothetical protein OAU50_01165, partial [Planctomycetota bacterium]|nr:hypothetical protein [Planctomycetota bacterium]
TESSKKKKAATQKYLADVQPELKKWWDEKKTEYEKRWASNVRKAFNDSIKDKSYDKVRDELNKAVGTDDATMIDKLRTAVGKLSGDTQTKAQTLLSVVETNTAQDRYFAGTIFIYDLAEYLEAKALEMEERARPLTVRTLKYFQLYREMKDNAGELSKGDLASVSKQYFRIRDWNNTIKFWQQYVDKHGGVKRWGKETSITVNLAQKVVGRDNANDELEIKYQLGRAYLERYKTDGDVADLKAAALLLRRCHNYNLIRDAIEIAKINVEMRFKKAIEQYYLVINDGMAECYLMLHKADVNMDWPKYKDQYNKELKAKGDQWNPNNKAEFLYAAIKIHKNVWMSFRLLEAYQYRTEFRSNYVAWLKLMVEWKTTFGPKDEGVEAIKRIGGAKEWLDDAFKSAEAEQMFDASSHNESTTKFIDTIKTYGAKLK